MPIHRDPQYRVQGEYCEHDRERPSRCRIRDHHHSIYLQDVVVTVEGGRDLRKLHDVDLRGRAGAVLVEIVFEVNGMTCAHCERAITAELAELRGVTGVDVDTGSGWVRVQAEAPVPREEIARAVDDAGYELESWLVRPDE
ncbi:heavy-metal-associated domain-containing protein [Microbacterium sp. NIBRBAC000506063]|nr:heavy-metal-associated domain-containing protein [Microbacterium sp. NIBRBAC000506063]